MPVVLPLSPALTGAPWVDPRVPASFEAFGFVVESATWSGLPDNQVGGELVMQLVAMASTEAGLAILVRWLHRVTSRCGSSWPEVTFAEHCPNTDQLPLCPPGEVQLVDDGRRTMVCAERISFAQQDIAERDGQYIETINITWRTRRPLITGTVSIGPIPIEIGALSPTNPAPAEEALFLYDDGIRRYGTRDRSDWCSPSMLGIPWMRKITCFSSLDEIVLDLTLRANTLTPPTAALRNWRVELHPWRITRPLPTVAEARNLLKSHVPCATFHVGDLRPGETVCIAPSRGGSLLRPGRNQTGRGIFADGSWVARGDVNYGFLLIAWPNGDTDMDTGFEGTPPGWEFLLDVHLVKGGV